MTLLSTNCPFSSMKHILGHSLRRMLFPLRSYDSCYEILSHLRLNQRTELHPVNTIKQQENLNG